MKSAFIEYVLEVFAHLVPRMSIVLRGNSVAISTYLLWKTYVQNIAENCACLVLNVWVGAQRAVGDLFASNEIMP